MSFKKKVALLFDNERGNAKGDFLIEYFILALIVFNTIIIILESFKEINDLYQDIFRFIEVFSIIIFSVEYLIRIWVADLIYSKLSPTRARIKYVTSFMGIIDLIAILPFYIPYLIKVDLRVVRVLRLFRLLRILKLERNFKSLKLIRTVIKKTSSEIAVTVFLVSILLVLASILMYNFENAAQPESFKNIGQSLWWAVATLTTVGYGDIYPITAFGKILSAIIALLGIGIVALPTGIISSAYIEEIQKIKKRKYCECPHCGKEIIK